MQPPCKVTFLAWIPKVPSGLWFLELGCICSISSGSWWRLRRISIHTVVWRGDGVRPGVVGDVTEESLLVTSRTRRTLCWCAETSSPAPHGSRCEGQNTWEKREGGEINHFHFIWSIYKITAMNAFILVFWMFATGHWAAFSLSILQTILSRLCSLVHSKNQLKLSYLLNK